MSRVGNKPVEIPAGVKVSVDGQTVTVEGPKGTLTRTFRPEIEIAMGDDGKSVVCSIRGAATRQARALWGTTRSLINNMVVGVNSGYERSLDIVGVGWGAQVAGKELKLSVGYASPIPVTIPDGVEVKVDKQIVRISGPDKQAVGQMAAMTRAVRKPEPYNGKGIKYTDEVIRRKQGKQFGS
ncbi:MAG TPA: 50S ribosomal protein L6 [Phycisphaerales bacterium]|nr:50S ribosomal protein L6 [Phycisphaerales bacterium]